MSGIEMSLLLIAGLLLVLVGMALAAMLRPSRKRKGKQEPKLQPQKTDFSKRLISDIRVLLWVVTVGGLLLAAYCIRSGFTGSLPWVSAMVGLPWAAHGTVCSFYLNMAKSDHSQGGITYEAAKAANFNVPQEPEGSVDSPAI